MPRSHRLPSEIAAGFREEALGFEVVAMISSANQRQDYGARGDKLAQTGWAINILVI
jgi:hypothetical protein